MKKYKDKTVYNPYLMPQLVDDSEYKAMNDYISWKYDRKIERIGK